MRESRVGRISWRGAFDLVLLDVRERDAFRAAWIKASGAVAAG